MLKPTAHLLLDRTRCRLLPRREGTAVMTGGVHRCHLIMYSPPNKTVSMLSNETGGVKSLDFSPDGKLVVSGALRKGILPL